MATSLNDSVPGTIHLIDLDHTIQTKHSGIGDIELVRTPSFRSRRPAQLGTTSKTAINNLCQPVSHFKIMSCHLNTGLILF